ncbi:MAG: hypothetical protein SP1CHLAM54_09220 [Chlamydiia bacterium]|nr:hypothetical protein [Chlamydiia bacterium]MCH9615828.1 hypothetical protein [Chlamydiia bacterium]MCH9628769.1 hypothetical protein [Chlamydiia bacterium]
MTDATTNTPPPLPKGTLIFHVDPRGDRSFTAYIEAMLIMLKDNKTIDKFKLKELAHKALLEGLLKQLTKSSETLTPSELLAYLKKLSTLAFLTPEEKSSFLNAINAFNQAAASSKGPDASYIDEWLAWLKLGMPGGINGFSNWSKGENSAGKDYRKDQGKSLTNFILNAMRACGWPASKMPSYTKVHYEILTGLQGNEHISAYQLLSDVFAKQKPDSNSQNLYEAWMHGQKAEAVKIGIRFVSPANDAKAAMTTLKNDAKSFTNDLKGATEVVGSIQKVFSAPPRS